RALAAEAVEGGKVELNGEKPKRAKHVKPGDRIRIRLGPYEHLLTVLAVSERRGPATVAATLYQEDPDGKRRREQLALQHRLAPPAFDFGEGKPSKKQRREIRRLRDRD
ncbi:MAG TPA: hypothetical protein VLL51_11555, partial [Gemmatimonadales bacterium]|nr:hypothetical protein [Gemmatimonadales bacterium]